MPPWTTTLSAPFKGRARYTAAAGHALYTVQLHPHEPALLLVRQRGTSKPLSLSPNDVLHVRFSDSRPSCFHVQHIQHIPSWKHNIKTAVLSGFFAEY